AWNVDGRGVSIWDTMCHNHPEAIADRSTGDVACESYYNYQADINILKNLGVDHYRFSISWTRLYPSGFINKTNPAGVNYYKNLIRLLRENNIEPVVTIHHWDLPQTLQDAGGWTNEFIVDIFADYARTCFELFGDEVKYWITVNEPFEYCHNGHGTGIFAPGLELSGTGEYWCAHNIIKGHAKVWHLYDEHFRATQKGKISLTVDSFWFEPASDSPKDKAAAERQLQFMAGWFLNPIFNGDYPKIMRERIAERSKLEGFRRSRLPRFTKEEIQYIKGTHDFLGYNYYTSFLAKNIPEPEIGQMSLENDARVKLYQPSNWESSSGPQFKITPWGLRKILKWLKDNYNNPKIFITENGVPLNEALDDSRRIGFIQSHLSNVRDAMEKDGVRVIAYTVWSLMDDFEWNSGYTYVLNSCITSLELLGNNFDSQKLKTIHKNIQGVQFEKN
ncbi:hypothetical protein NQ318_014872, partial [Aromia moschata]